MNSERIYRCFFDGPLETGSSVRLGGEEERHLMAVRRKASGMALVINGRGREASAAVIAIGRRSAELRIESARDAPPPTATERLGLALSLIRHEPFETTLRQAVELGVTDFWALAAERSVVNIPPDRLNARLGRWRRIAIEALKQSERLWLPRLHGVAPLDEALDESREAGLTPLVLMERSVGSAQPLADAAKDHAGGPIAIFIGPEGGWSPEEGSIFARHHAATAHFGVSILRTETAAVASIATMVAQRLTNEVPSRVQHED